MEQQEWRRRALPGGRRPTLADDAKLAGGAGSHTVASAGKITRKSAPAALSMPPPPPSSSRWKELRQAVRIKATMAAEPRCVVDARIADLCAEDREKVAKLIRRIVEACSNVARREQIGTLQEESEAEFGRQRGVLEAEIRELREQVKRDASELEELSDTLKATLLKLRDYQERVLVLEESSESDARRRLESDETVDLLKLEVEKLRQLVRKQSAEMAEKAREEQAQHHLELERARQQLRDAQEELLSERRDRIQEKQRELDERLARSMASAPAASTKEAAVREAPSLREHEQPSLADMSSFLNTSMELPERIRDIMDEWKQRMEDALAGTVQRLSEQPVPGVPVHDDTRAGADAAGDGEDAGDADLSAGVELRSENATDRRRHSRTASDELRSSRTPRHADPNRFDRYLRANSHSAAESEDDSDSDASDGGSHDGGVSVEDEESESRSRDRHTHKRAPASRRHRSDRESDAVSKTSTSHRSSRRRHPPERDPRNRERRARRQLNLEYEDDVAAGSQQPFVLIDTLQGGRRAGSSSGFSGLFESSLFEVVDAIEGESVAPDARVLLGSRHLDGVSDASHRDAESRSDARGSEAEAASPTSTSSAARLQSLLRGMQVRERKLARLDVRSVRDEALGAPSALDGAGGDADDVPDADDFELFDQVRDLYESDLLSRRAGASGAALSPRDMAVREAVEHEMAELLLQQHAARRR